MLAQVRTRCEVTERERHRHLVADQLTERPLRDSLCGDPGRDVTGGRVDPRLVRRGGSFAGREPREQVVSRRCMCVLRVGIQLVDDDLGIARAVAQELSQCRRGVRGRQFTARRCRRLVQVDQTALGQTEQQHRGHGLRDREQLERHGGVRREVGCAARQAVPRFVHDPSVTRHGHGQTDQRRLVQVTLRQAIHHLRRRRIGDVDLGRRIGRASGEHDCAEEHGSRNHVADSTVPGAAPLTGAASLASYRATTVVTARSPVTLPAVRTASGMGSSASISATGSSGSPMASSTGMLDAANVTWPGRLTDPSAMTIATSAPDCELKHRQIDAVEPRDETRRAKRIRGTRDPEQRDCERQYHPRDARRYLRARESRLPA